MNTIPPFVSTIASQGILGLLLAVSLVANWYFIKKNQEINNSRVKDAQDFSNKLLEPINNIKQNSELLISLLTRILNGSGMTKA